ncbi:MAG: translation initiation factor IF-2 [Candidatus Eremiobacter antarcticus]|nr:translation initiation factor IF-2 [Candidatus Eremiobacteraeota bacterium]MBC5807567.1 translation initiation factor IF-2 [Candidatus Eremiobacteraeota bacterium]PZR61382.1 MAG: translation initiation factor IF-2 [Candidatus Eremiobacter sp. RRmetagenome_bin22]
MTTTVRVHELAKELNLSSKDTIALLGKVGIQASTHMSVIDEHRARIVKGVLLGSLANAAKGHKPAAKHTAGNGAPALAPAAAPVSSAVTAPPAAPPPQTQVVEPLRPVPERQAPPSAPVGPAPAMPVAPAASGPAAPPVQHLQPVPSGQKSVMRPPSTHKVVPAASASPSTPVPVMKPGPIPERQERPPARPLDAPNFAGPDAGTGLRPPLRRDGAFPGRPLPPRPMPGRPLPGRGLVPGSAPSPTSGPAPSGTRKRSREDQERDRKEREREELLNKSQQRHKTAASAPAAEPAVLKDLEIPDLITVQQLAAAMEIPAGQVIAQLIKMGTMATINQHIPSDVGSQVARRFGFNTIVKEAGEEVAEIVVDSDPVGSLTARPPVVTVLGHVDHGKTSLLDAIRSTKVAAGEAGGITQRIGAYTVEYGDRKVTFIDTPGHEAFTEMRARGAKVTDVAILVVAADDGVMPQTIEAMNHAKAAGVPIVVAVNKVDKPNANVDRVKQQLSDQGLTPEEWGGQTQFIPVSAKQKTGIDELLDMVLLNADLLELKSNKSRRAQGVIIEAQLDRARGPVATVLVKNGTLRVGDIVVVGSTWGRVRALFDDKLEAIKRAGPAIPAEIMGLSDVPAAGDILEVVSDERDARELAAKRSQRKREQRMATARRTVTLDGFLAQAKEGGQRDLNLIIKADAQGSVEALRAQLDGLANEEVRTRVIHTGVGGINESDVMLASASNAIIIGFNIRPDATIARKAEAEGVDVRLYDVIYNVIDEVKAAMTGMLKPQTREVVQGQAEIRQTFKVSKIGTIAGCYVRSGKVTRDSRVRLLRDSALVYEGKLASLKRFKDDVREVAEGYECGMAIENFNDIKEGDVIEAFTTEQVAAAGVA